MGYCTFGIILFLYLVTISKSNECPEKCSCKHSTQKDGPDWIKLRCGDSVTVAAVDELDLMDIADEIIQLNLTRNHLTTFATKVQLLALQKLDISKNYLTILYNHQFIDVPNIRRLDISGNNIKTIETFAFSNLRFLERLKLDHNHIVTIAEITFNPMVALKQLDISNNPLTCDCDLLWLLEWARKSLVKLMSNPKCTSPASFRGTFLRKLQVGVDIHCKSPAGDRDLPLLDILPYHDQVVFEGDSLTLTCQAQSILESFEINDLQNSKSQVQWLWSDADPREVFEEVDLNTRYIAENGILISSLRISLLNQNHTGSWSCRLNSDEKDYLRSINVIVISNETKYCPSTITNSNKGTYFWPTTISNNVVKIPCESIQMNGNITEQTAQHFCSFTGEWVDLNMSRCSYVLETTKILHQFSQVNLSLTKANIYESVKHFKNYTSNLRIFKDSVDLFFAVETIKNYLNYLGEEKELAAVLMDILNEFFDLPSSYITMVDLSYNISSKIVNYIEKIAKFTTTTLLHKSNIAAEEFPVKQEVFAGMTCTWYINPFNISDRLFYCMTSNRPVLPGVQDHVVEASIQIPSSLFYQLQEQDIVLDRSMQKLLVVMYKNGKLFPLGKEHHNRYISSAVVGVKLANISVTNLTDPIYVMLRVPSRASLDPISAIPVWWNESTNDGKGNWSTDGCEYSHEIQDNLVFRCQQFGYYGLLQNVTYSEDVLIGAKFRWSHPAIYVGSLLLFVSLFIVILTYCVCYVSIQMPRKAKHSLINMWIAVVLLMFVYIFGIYQTEDVQLCQIIGLILHYLTLCSLFWMCVGVTTIYKRLSKNEVNDRQDDELPSDEPIQKPILGLYLIGWGVALIVCGISGAVNMKEYAMYDRCFLNSSPALSALIIPAIVLLLILGALFLLIRCAIYSLDASGHLSEGTQVTENVDLDNLEPNCLNVDRRSLVSIKTRSSEVEDAEHAPLTQLKAYIIFLVLYCIAWLSCALATIKPFKFSYEEDVFSIAYSIFATLLGAFTVFFYCIARNDIRTQWLMFHNTIHRKGFFFRSRNVSDTIQNLPQIQIQPTPLEVRINSRSSSRSSSQTKSYSNNSNILKAVANLNDSSVSEDVHGARINNVNLVVLHRQQYRNPLTNLIENPADTAQMFYNPYQSTVARRFFRKQRQHMMKRNNLTSMRKCLHSDTNSVVSTKQITDNSSIDRHRNMFGTNSKVNNKNIHVECVKKTKYRNLNVLSDSQEELNIIPIEKLMLNAERLRKRELNRPRIRKKQNLPSSNENRTSAIEENNMRTVSQQCSLDYSSDSISILEKNAQKKINYDSLPSKSTENVMGKKKYRRSKYYKNNRSFPTSKINTPSEQPSDLSLSVVNSNVSELSEAVPKIYVNPSHDLLLPKRVQSRASSVSTSELDELYQQIRRCDNFAPNQNFGEFRRPRLSDPEINLTLRGLRHGSRLFCSNEDLSDNLETVV